MCAAPKSLPPTIDRAGIQITNVVAMADVGPAKLVLIDTSVAFYIR